MQPPLISDYDDGGFTIAGEFYQGSILITGIEGEGFQISPWCVEREGVAVDIRDDGELTADHFTSLYEGFTPQNTPQLILIGVGPELLHPYNILKADLGKMATALEIQSTSAACRTWNLLLSEGRRVVFAGIAI